MNDSSPPSPTIDDSGYPSVYQQSQVNQWQKLFPGVQGGTGHIDADQGYTGLMAADEQNFRESPFQSTLQDSNQFEMGARANPNNDPNPFTTQTFGPPSRQKQDWQNMNALPLPPTPLPPQNQPLPQPTMESQPSEEFKHRCMEKGGRIVRVDGGFECIPQRPPAPTPLDYQSKDKESSSYLMSILVVFGIIAVVCGGYYFLSLSNNNTGKPKKDALKISEK